MGHAELQERTNYVQIAVLTIVHVVFQPALHLEQADSLDDAVASAFGFAGSIE